MFCINLTLRVYKIYYENRLFETINYKLVFILTQVNLQKLNQQKKRPFCLENKSKTFLLLKNTNHSRNCVQQREKWNLLINDFPLLQLDELDFQCSFFWVHMNSSPLSRFSFRVCWCKTKSINDCYWICQTSK